MHCLTGTNTLSYRKANHCQALCEAAIHEFCETRTLGEFECVQRRISLTTWCKRHLSAFSANKAIDFLVRRDRKREVRSLLEVISHNATPIGPANCALFSLAEEKSSTHVSSLITKNMSGLGGSRNDSEIPLHQKWANFLEGNALHFQYRQLRYTHPDTVFFCRPRRKLQQQLRETTERDVTPDGPVPIKITLRHPFVLGIQDEELNTSLQTGRPKPPFLSLLTPRVRLVLRPTFERDLRLGRRRGGITTPREKLAI